MAGLARRWSLAVGAPFEPGGECAWVAPVVSATDGDVVLKVGWTHDEARDEAAGLGVWDGRGAVRLLDAVVEGETSALLLERAVPGSPLSTRDGPEQDVVLAGLLRRLWADPGAGHPFRPLHEMCDAWIEQARPELGHLDPGLVRDGLALFADLPRDDTPHVLLATDLHAENVLAAQREPWLVIDPKPYVGDPAYDVLQHMLNDRGQLLADPRGFARCSTPRRPRSCARRRWRRWSLWWRWPGSRPRWWSACAGADPTRKRRGDRCAPLSSTEVRGRSAGSPAAPAWWSARSSAGCSRRGPTA